MNRGLFNANQVLAFVLEIAALAAFAAWGLKVGDGVLVKGALAVGAPLLAAILLGLFAAPRARYKIPLAGQLAVKAPVFGAAAVVLFAAGHWVLGTVFAVVVLLNTVAATIWRARGFEFGT